MVHPDPAGVLEDSGCPLQHYQRGGYFGGQVRISGGGTGEEGLIGIHGVGRSTLRKDLHKDLGVVAIFRHHGIIVGR